jgi:Holliday junction resolvase RusA-like endonuclease
VKQTLVLEGQLHPTDARRLSPNGRCHWAEKRGARRRLQLHVLLAASSQGLQPMGPPVCLTIRQVVPDHRRRDPDNLVACCKAIPDALVSVGILVGDDSAVLHLAPVELVVEKGQRRLEIVLESEGEG